MALTERQIQARKGKITASRIGALMSGDREEIYDLWLELTGDPSFVPPDFSKVWAVQLGNATEQFHLDWVQSRLGPIAMRGKSFQHPKVPWALSTLDGWVEDANYAIEAKHVGGFEPMDTIIDRYMPQMHWTMYCTETEEIAFSVIAGAKEPKPVVIQLNTGYMAELLERATAFLKHVVELTEPVVNPYLKPPLPVFSGMADMTKSNSWAETASLWLTNRPAHIEYEAANKHIKKLVPASAKEAFGHGVRAKRNSAGSITIKAEGDDED